MWVAFELALREHGERIDSVNLGILRGLVSKGISNLN